MTAALKLMFALRRAPRPAASIRLAGAAEKKPGAPYSAAAPRGNARRCGADHRHARRTAARGSHALRQLSDRSTSIVSHQFGRGADARRLVAVVAANPLHRRQPFKIGDVLAVPSERIVYAVQRRAGNVQGVDARYLQVKAKIDAVIGPTAKPAAADDGVAKENRRYLEPHRANIERLQRILRDPLSRPAEPK